MYELIIEQANKKQSDTDNSIDHIVFGKTELNKSVSTSVSNMNIENPKNKKYLIHRLTENIIPSNEDMCPITSTPNLKKSYHKSINEYSPIIYCQLGTSKYMLNEQTQNLCKDKKNDSSNIFDKKEISSVINCSTDASVVNVQPLQKTSLSVNVSVLSIEVSKINGTNQNNDIDIQLVQSSINKNVSAINNEKDRTEASSSTQRSLIDLQSFYELEQSPINSVNLLSTPDKKQVLNDDYSTDRNLIEIQSVQKLDNSTINVNVSSTNDEYELLKRDCSKQKINVIDVQSFQELEQSSINENLSDIIDKSRVSKENYLNQENHVICVNSGPTQNLCLSSNMSLIEEPFLGFTNEPKTIIVDYLPTVKDLDNLTETESVHNMSKDLFNSKDSLNDNNIHLEEDDLAKSELINTNDTNVSHEFFDACSHNSALENHSLTELKKQCLMRQPIVQLDKINVNSFQILQMSDHSDEISKNGSKYLSESSDYDEVVRNETINSSTDINKTDSMYLSYNELTPIEVNNSEQITEYNKDNSLENNSLGDNYISFVTTRRRNDTSKRSTIFILNNSDCNSNDPEVQETILSNNDSKYVNISPSYAEVISKTKHLIGNFNAEEENITCRKSTSHRESLLTSDRLNDTKIASNNDNCRPNIVLQPGKKWERSLSIYKRMTTMNDHFNISALEEESLSMKGRKYRQSVIDTMELQDQIGMRNFTIYLFNNLTNNNTTIINYLCKMVTFSDSVNNCTLIRKSCKPTVQMINVSNVNHNIYF